MHILVRTGVFFLLAIHISIDLVVSNAASFLFQLTVLFCGATNSGLYTSPGQKCVDWICDGRVVCRHDGWTSYSKLSERL